MPNAQHQPESQTSLKTQKSYWHDALLISTGLLIYGMELSDRKLFLNGITLPNRWSSLHDRMDPLCLRDTSRISGTILNFTEPLFTFASTTLVQNELQEVEDLDFAIKLKFKREFKIQVKTLRLDKSRPKIFID